MRYCFVTCVQMSVQSFESSFFRYTAEVRPDWAPHGTLRFLELAAAGANFTEISFLEVSMCIFQWFYMSRWLWWPCILSCCAWLRLGSKFPHGGACCHQRDVHVTCDWYFSLDLCLVATLAKLLLLLVCGKDGNNARNNVLILACICLMISQPATKWCNLEFAHFMLILCIAIS